jgi:hypothetical protein
MAQMGADKGKANEALFLTTDRTDGHGWKTGASNQVGFYP